MFLPLRGRLGGGILIIALCLLGCTQSLPPTVAEYCDTAEFAPPTDPNVTVITVQTSAPRNKCGRVYAPVWAAASLPEIAVEPRPLLTSMGNANQLLLDAVRTGKDVPDVVYVSSVSAPGTIRALQEMGDMLFPIDQCTAPFPTMADEDHWYPLHDERVPWGVPAAVTVDPLFYSKKMLRRLGWSEAAIASLPEQIATGQFTLNDMLQTAENAIEQGVVPAGLGFVLGAGFWEVPPLLYLSHGGEMGGMNPDYFELDVDALTGAYTTMNAMYQQQLTVNDLLNDLDSYPNRVMFNDVLAKGEALFWVRPLDKWSYWELDHIPAGMSLDENVGIALFPAAQSGDAGVLRSYRPSYYLILSEQATGRANQQAACRLLAETMKPEHIGRYHVQFKALSPLANPAYPTTTAADAAVFAQLTTMMRYASEETFAADGRYTKVRGSIFYPITGLAMGETVDDTVDLAIQSARGTLGSNLILYGDNR